MSAKRRAMLDPFYGLTPQQARSFAEGLDQARQRQLERLVMGTEPVAKPEPPRTIADFLAAMEEMRKVVLTPTGRSAREYSPPFHPFPMRKSVREYPIQWASFLVYSEADTRGLRTMTLRLNPKRSPLGYQPEPDA